MFIVVVDSTMMNVAISQIVKDLKTDLGSVQAAISIYSLVMAALIMTGAKLGDVRGIKRMFTIGIVIFGVGTLLAAVSWNIWILTLGWSIIEGIGAALILPLAFALIFANYEGRERAIGFGLLGGVMASASAVGPILGGVLTTYLSWRVGFAGEVVVVIIILPLIPYIRESAGDAEGSVDWFGSLFSIVGLGSLVLGFILAGRYGWWDAKREFTIGGTNIVPLGLSVTPFLMAFGLVMIAVFLHWQQRREARDKSPLARISLFKNGHFVAGFSTTTFENLFLAGMLFVIPVFLQSAIGFSAIRTGVALLPFSLLTFIIAMVSPGWGEKVAPKYLIQIGFAMMAGGLLILYAITDLQISVVRMIVPMAITGIGTGLVVAHVVNLTLSAVKPEENTEASGVNSSMRNLGGALGPAIIGSILFASFYGGIVDDVLRSDAAVVSPQERRQIVVDLEDDLQQATPEELESYASQLPEEAGRMLDQTVNNSMVNAQQNALLALVFMAVIPIILASFLSSTKVGKPEQEALVEVESVKT